MLPSHLASAISKRASTLSPSDTLEPNSPPLSSSFNVDDDTDEFVDAQEELVPSPVPTMPSNLTGKLSTSQTG